MRGKVKGLLEPQHFERTRAFMDVVGENVYAVRTVTVKRQVLQCRLKERRVDRAQSLVISREIEEIGKEVFSGVILQKRRPGDQVRFLFVFVVLFDTMLPVCRWRRLCEVPVKQATATAPAAATATTSSYVIVTIIIIIFVVIFKLSLRRRVNEVGRTGMKCCGSRRAGGRRARSRRAR